MSTLDPSPQAFEAAKNAFRKSLKDERLFKDLLETTSIEKVWDAAKEVQAKQDAEKRLRHMAKMKSFLEKLSAYASTVETFVQLKPDAMALIWGAVRLLLVWTGNITKFADAVIKAVRKIGDALPQFVEVVKTFNNNDRLKDVLALFYRDILDFYAIALRFFNLLHKFCSIINLHGPNLRPLTTSRTQDLLRICLANAAGQDRRCGQ